MRSAFICMVLLVAGTWAESGDSGDDDDVQVPRDVNIDAAFRYGDDLFLIAGDEYMAVSPQGIERYMLKRTGETHVPVGLDIQAAVRWPRKPTMYFFGAEVSYRVNETDKRSVEKPYGKKRKFLQNGGPDAAVFLGGYFYLFKGCEYVAQKGTLANLGPVEKYDAIGLPCDMDAAWESVNGKYMTVLKGNLIWTMDKEGNVKGPKPFDSEYVIWSWQLTPHPDSRFQL